MALHGSSWCVLVAKQHLHAVCKMDEQDPGISTLDDCCAHSQLDSCVNTRRFGYGLDPDLVACLKASAACSSRTAA